MFYVSSTVRLKTLSRSSQVRCLWNLFYEETHFRATGVTTAVVESMEKSFKKDVLRELRLGGGRILLHDEVEERPGVFSIIPLWETVSEGDILTPRDVMELVAQEGYKVGSMTDLLPQALKYLVRSIMAALLLQVIFYWQ